MTTTTLAECLALMQDAIAKTQLVKALMDEWVKIPNGKPAAHAVKAQYNEAKKLEDAAWITYRMATNNMVR